ncbi:hypothetical protein AB0O07_15300 [Streptomyces sp. NPDC093085]|uniref:hypothetical protein n=1 Tax=Streptomyces sp. NPDC093085 TaxID=3155068 RepID=UPI00343B0376
MSRETDSSSSGPQRRGGAAAYPSGTPPYGSRQYPSLHPQQDAPEETGNKPAAQPDEPRTETTLTTRIRINIPGSRPIPPVVMRTPMSDIDATEGRGVPAAERTGATPKVAPAQDMSETRPIDLIGEQRAAAQAAKGADGDSGEKSTSDWFAPRKATTGAASGMTAAAAAVSGVTSAPPSATRSAPPGGERQAESPYGTDYSNGTDYSTGSHPIGGAPAGSDYANGTDYSTGSHRIGGSSLSDLAAEGLATGGSTGAGAGAPAPGANGFAPGGGLTTPAFGTRPPGAPVGPTGPTTGPVPGSSSLGTPPSSLANPPGADQGGGPRLSDDTAVLTPQQPAPEPASGDRIPGGPGLPGGHVSGDTLNSGIPVVPPEQRSPFPGSGPQGGGPRTDGGGDGAYGSEHDFSAPDFPGPVGAGPATPPQGQAAVGTAPQAKAPAAPAKKKGRSKVALLGVAVVVVASALYGAGLLMNHSDVPKGTTVLGVDIGGTTREEAVNRLDATLGERASAPLRLSIGGKTEELAPDKAGLSLDSQATVRNAAGSDYNPVSVIGSLFGSARVAQPVIPVDEEKLSVALTDLAGVSGSASDGTIKFEPGRAVAVPGKAGKALDVNHSIISTRDAYRAQVQTGKTNSVELPVVTREPTVDQAELDRAMKEFAEPAMSGLVTIQAGGKQIQFGPAKSLPKILSMKAIDGKLVEVYDRDAIDQLLDGVFDGITITKGDGKQYPVSSADVVQAMQKALRGKTPAERTQTIDLDPS